MKVFEDENIESEFQEFLDDVIFQESRLLGLLDEAVRISIENKLSVAELELDFYLSAADFFKQNYAQITLMKKLEKSIDLLENVEDNNKRILN